MGGLVDLVEKYPATTGAIVTLIVSSAGLWAAIWRVLRDRQRSKLLKAKGGFAQQQDLDPPSASNEARKSKPLYDLRRVDGGNLDFKLMTSEGPLNMTIGGTFSDRLFVNGEMVAKGNFESEVKKFSFVHNDQNIKFNIRTQRLNNPSSLLYIISVFVDEIHVQLVEYTYNF